LAGLVWDAQRESKSFLESHKKRGKKMTRILRFLMKLIDEILENFAGRFLAQANP
jgi:hypothetical protein